jgi:hypothetical protein
MRRLAPDPMKITNDLIVLLPEWCQKFHNFMEGLNEVLKMDTDWIKKEKGIHFILDLL